MDDTDGYMANNTYKAMGLLGTGDYDIHPPGGQPRLVNDAHGLAQRMWGLNAIIGSFTRPPSTR
jgi:hypothetical protein